MADANWFRTQRYGMFIHCNIATVPAFAPVLLSGGPSSGMAAGQARMNAGALRVCHACGSMP